MGGDIISNLTNISAGNVVVLLSGERGENSLIIKFSGGTDVALQFTNWLHDEWPCIKAKTTIVRK